MIYTIRFCTWVAPDHIQDFGSCIDMRFLWPICKRTSKTTPRPLTRASSPGATHAARPAVPGLGARVNASRPKAVAAVTFGIRLHGRALTAMHADASPGLQDLRAGFDPHIMLCSATKHRSAMAAAQSLYSGRRPGGKSLFAPVRPKSTHSPGAFPRISRKRRAMVCCPRSYRSNAMTSALAKRSASIC